LLFHARGCIYIYGHTIERFFDLYFVVISIAGRDRYNAKHGQAHTEKKMFQDGPPITSLAKASFESDAMTGTVIGGMVARTLIRVNMVSDTNTYQSRC